MYFLLAIKWNGFFYEAIETALDEPIFYVKYGGVEMNNFEIWRGHVPLTLNGGDAHAATVSKKLLVCVD